MPDLIDALTAQGYSLKTVTEIIEMQKTPVAKKSRLLRGGVDDV
eukprot:gene33311-41106_t